MDTENDARFLYDDRFLHGDVPTSEKIKHGATYLQGRPVSGMYCHSDILIKKVKDVPNFRF